MNNVHAARSRTAHSGGGKQEEPTMGQVNVNPGSSSSAPRGDGGAATIFGMGMMMFTMLAGLVIVVLAVGWFVVRPMMFSGPSNSTINVTVPQQQQPAPAAPAPAAPAAPA